MGANPAARKWVIGSAAGFAGLLIALVFLGFGEWWLFREMRIALERYDAPAVKRLLGFGARPGWKGQNGETSLMAAAFCGDVEFADRLIRDGVDVNAVDGYGRSALYLTAGNPDPLLLRHLLAAGARPDPPGGRLALVLTAGHGTPEVAQDLMDAGANVDAGDEWGTPLRSAAYLGRARMVAWLLDHGADWRLKNKRGDTALSSARAQASRHPFQKADYDRVIALLESRSKRPH